MPFIPQPWIKCCLSKRKNVERVKPFEVFNGFIRLPGLNLGVESFSDEQIVSIIA